MSQPTRVSRRGFLARSAAFAGIPTIVPSEVLARPGRPGANDRIGVGVIGLGAMGRGHVTGDTVALCDVNDRHLAGAARRVRGRPFLCRDYRRLLDRRDVDAVIIATPDPWHALQTVHACQAGKDVYVEHPACAALEEIRAMVRAARRYERVVQVGAQGRSNPVAHAACTFLRNGELGRVSRVEVWHAGSPADWGSSSTPPPSPSPWPGSPRSADVSRALRAAGGHALSLLFWFLDLSLSGTVSVDAAGEPGGEGDPQGAGRLAARWELRDPRLVITWSQPLPCPGGAQELHEARLAGLPPGWEAPRLGSRPWGQRLHGSRGTLVVFGGDGSCDTDARVRGYRVPPGGERVFRSPGHRENWLDCIRTRQRPVADIEEMAAAVSLPLLALLSHRLGRKLEWDPVAHRFSGDAEANRLLDEPLPLPRTPEGSPKAAPYCGTTEVPLA